MSYILEALKKSQQERELGRVPTLDTSSLFVEDTETGPPNYWPFVSVGLASLAVLIALYAALRQGNGPGAAPPQVTLAQPQSTPEPRAPAFDLPARQEVTPPAEPLVEAPPPKRYPRPVPAAPIESPASDSGEPSPDHYAVPAALGPDLRTEEELLSQLQAEQLALSDSDGSIESEPAPRTAIPSDLVKDIQAFKDQVRRQQGGAAPSASGVPITGDPTRLRLTSEQRAMLPEYLMTVHVYDQDPDKRFVIINGNRYREKEETREGLRVEQILKDGVVLSHLGNPFYVSR